MAITWCTLWAARPENHDRKQEREKREPSRMAKYDCFLIFAAVCGLPFWKTLGRTAFVLVSRRVVLTHAFDSLTHCRHAVMTNASARALFERQYRLYDWSS
jgi:hypothetical protein